MADVLLVGRSWVRAQILTSTLTREGYVVRQIDPWLARVEVLKQTSAATVIFDVTEPEDEEYLGETVEQCPYPVLLLTHRHEPLGIVHHHARRASPSDVRAIVRALKALVESR